MSRYQKKVVGKRVRLLREKKRWTRSNMAEYLDVSDRYCSSIELGQKGMSIKTLIHMTRALDVSADYILTGMDMENARPERYDAAVRWLDRCPLDKLPYLEEMVQDYLLSLEKDPPGRVGRKLVSKKKRG